MGYVHISKSKGRTIEDFRTVSAKHNPPQDIDGLLAWAAGSDENGLQRGDRVAVPGAPGTVGGRAALPRVPGVRHGRGLPANSEFTEYETGELYVR